MFATPASPPPTQTSQGGLLSMFSEPPFMISLSCQIEAEKASSKPFTFDWSDMISPIVGEHDSYSSPPGSPTSVQHVNTYPTVAYGPSHFQTEPTKLSSHITSYQTRLVLRKSKQFVSSSAESATTTQIPKSTKSNQKKVSFSSILEIRTHSLVLGDHPSCLGGMALECGWNRCEDPEIVDLKTFENASTKRRGSALRLCYSQRLERLQEATGLNGSQLLQMEYERVCGGASPLIRLDQ
jgi:hypothetical protein